MPILYYSFRKMAAHFRQSEEDYDDYLKEEKEKVVSRPFTPKVWHTG